MSTESERLHEYHGESCWGCGTTKQVLIPVIVNGTTQYLCAGCKEAEGR